MEKLYENLSNLFPVSRTLKFELIPCFETMEYFEKCILMDDENKALIYKKVKKYCDEYHRYFINECLKDFEDNTFKDLLNEFDKCFNIESKVNKELKDIGKVEDIQKKLRKIISEKFTKHPKYKSLFGKDLISLSLVEYFANDQKKLDEIKLFDGFSSYFAGFDTNRKNIYLDEEKHTSISYRLINENLPIYLNNIKIFNIILNNIPDIKEKIKQNLNIDCEKYFKNVENYNQVLTQEKIEEYNLLIAGKSEENIKLQGINEIVNLYKQKNDIKIPKLKELYKQILSDTNSISFKFDIINDDKELIEMINDFYSIFKVNFIGDDTFKQAINNIGDYNIKNIYLNNDASLTTLSQNVYKDWNYINYLIELDYDRNYNGKIKIGTSKYNEKKENEVKKIKEISISKIEELIKIYDEESHNSMKLVEYFKNSLFECYKIIDETYNNVKSILEANYDDNSKILLQNCEAVECIKKFLDAIKNLQNLIKYLIPKNNSLDIDFEFYNALNYNLLSEIIPVYNRTRNYLTQKPYSLEKFKLNFSCPTFLNGWDLNKEDDNLGIILRKDGCFYLGIINKNNRKLFSKKEKYEKNGDYYEKVEYKLLPGPNKMLPKVFFSKSRINQFCPKEELLTKYKAGFHKKGENFDLSFCHELIDFYKASISKHEDWSKFNFKFTETKKYEDISQFYREVETQGYNITFTNISSEYINQLVSKGKLYLFKIYNKDFSKYSKGTPNLHTLYWKALFDEDNLKNVVYKLNGGAEMFYRKKSIKANVTHPKNKPIDNKSINNAKKQSIFEYDLIKDKRFTVDKFQFHVPITLNFKAKGMNKFNDFINSEIKKASDIHVIGIDRGERHLLYICVINQNGEIVEQYSLNKLGNVDYNELLAKKENERNKARQSWGRIQNIKELKEGYMSQIVYKLTQLMFKYNAVVVLEDLNSGFKNLRKKVEKSVYDKFETKFIDKLSYLVDKSIENKFAQGSIMNAYQLSNKDIKSGKQNGILFYIPAWCTSKIDPLTGFVNLFCLKKIDKDFISKIDSIRFNSNENYFEFDIDYTNFSNKSVGKRTNWTLCTYGERILTSKSAKANGNWDNIVVELTSNFKKLFDIYNMDYNNLKEDIIKKADSKFFNAKEEKDGFYGFSILFKLLVQLRNSVSNSKEDYILSPVKTKNGFFYDSRNNAGKYPENADANGAYNIARKGLIIINRIKNKKDNESFNYIIKNEDWLTYVQEFDR